MYKFNCSEKNFIVQSDSQKNAQLADVTLLLATMWFNILIDHQQIEETWINDAIPTYLHLTVLENVIARQFYYGFIVIISIVFMLNR